MAFDFSPVDYSGMLGLRNQPDPRLLAQQQQQIDLQRQQQQALIFQQQQKQQAAQAYATDVQEYLKNPTPEGGQNLLLRHPDQAEAFKTYFQQRDQAAQDSDFKEMVRLDGLLSVGRAEEAKAALQARIDAGKAAGRPTPDEDMLLAQLNEDPKKAQGMLSVLIPSIGGVDNYAKILEQRRLAAGGPKLRDVAPGAAVIDETQIDPVTGQAKIIFESPYKPEIITDPVTGQKSEYRPSSPGGGQVSGQYKNGWAPRARNGGDNSDASVDNYIAHAATKLGISPDTPITPALIPKLADAMAEFEAGGSPNAISKRNNNPGNIRKGGQFVKYDTPEAGTAAQRGLLGRYIARGQNTIRSIIEGVPANGSAAPGSNVTPLTGGKPPDITRVMTPEEVSAIPGLDPNTVYQKKADGTITAVGGQSRSQLKPWPVAALQARTANNASLTNIDGVLNLLNPKNNAAAAVNARNAIGPGTGLLGDTFTQIHDPKGTDARARIGQIGGLIIKDTSGAAVSLSEDQRLAKWVPLVTDTPAVARSKLQNLKREIQQRNEAMDTTYSEDQGFRPFSQGGAAPGGFRILGVRPKQ